MNYRCGSNCEGEQEVKGEESSQSGIIYSKSSSDSLNKLGADVWDG